MKINVTFRALKYRNYRLFFTGQGFSLIGTWMQRVALGWLVYRLTQSPFLLGLVEFSAQLPAFLLTPIAGAYLDRLNRRQILIMTQIVAMLQALLLALLVFAALISMWQIILLSVVLGLVNAFDMPARQAFVLDMVERREDMANAIALNSSLFNIARLIGPSAAGFLIAVAGEGICFLINGLTFLTIIVALWSMRIQTPRRSERGKHVLKEVHEGMAYAYHVPSIRIVLLLLMLVSLVVLPYYVLLPVFAKDILGGGSRTLGFLTAAAGVGALFGAYFLASRHSIIGLEKVLFSSLLVTGVGILIISQLHVLWVTVLVLIFVGFGIMTLFAAGNTLLQTIVDDDKRARIMSLYTMTFLGMGPVGSLLAGILAGRIGAAATLSIGAVLCLAGAILYFKRIDKMRHCIQSVLVKQLTTNT